MKVQMLTLVVVAEVLLEGRIDIKRQQRVVCCWLQQWGGVGRVDVLMVMILVVLP